MVNRLTAADAASGTYCGYDSAGNLTATSAGYALVYNSRNQATSITRPGNAAVPMRYADVDNTERISAGSADFVNGPLGVTARTDVLERLVHLRPLARKHASSARP